jgi:hypothetical protein
MYVMILINPLLLSKNALILIKATTKAISHTTSFPTSVSATVTVARPTFSATAPTATTKSGADPIVHHGSSIQYSLYWALAVIAVVIL